jgi:hypothetical protein
VQNSYLYFKLLLANTRKRGLKYFFFAHREKKSRICTFFLSGLYMLHVRMKYLHREKKVYHWGQGVALIKEDIFRMLDYMEEAVLISQVDKEMTRKLLIMLADYVEHRYNWGMDYDAALLPNRIDKFMSNQVHVKDVLASKAKITEPYKLYKAGNEVAAHKDVLFALLLARLCNQTLATAVPKKVDFVEIYEDNEEASRRTARSRGHGAAVLQRANAKADKVFGTAFDDNSQPLLPPEEEAEGEDNDEERRRRRRRKRREQQLLPPPSPPPPPRLLTPSSSSLTSKGEKGKTPSSAAPPPRHNANAPQKKRCESRIVFPFCSLWTKVSNMYSFIMHAFASL